VAVACRELDGNIIFLYADDMNSPATKAQVKKTLSTSDKTFFPETASWINCLNYTYLPHSNKCGIRSLLAMTVQALHPKPSSTILLPYMHGNIANFGQSWLATTLLNSFIPPEPLTWILAQSNFHFSTHCQASTPFSLLQWSDQILSGTPLPRDDFSLEDTARSSSRLRR
jgi:hypothetical protein